MRLLLAAAVVAAFVSVESGYNYGSSSAYGSYPFSGFGGGYTGSYYSKPSFFPSSFGPSSFGGYDGQGFDFTPPSGGGGNGNGGGPPADNPGCGTPPDSCPKSRYSNLDGSCNNLLNPVLGTPNTPYSRLLGHYYADGISNPPVSVSGKPLPSSRLVSILLFPDVEKEDPHWTLLAMQYGQIITHDMSMIAGSTQTKPHSTQCCTSDGQLLELANIPEHCFPIVVPEDDPLYSKFNVKCTNFVRTLTDRDRRCVGGHKPAEQLTAVNHYLDLSIVYGNNQMVSSQVREFQKGRLRVDSRHGQDWPPESTNSSSQCALQYEDEVCYLAGDVRVNQNPQLTVLQVLLLREHNRIADTLAHLNPHWDDETIYQEARKINIAQHQHVSYYEWLPIFIGVENSLRNKIIYETKGFVNDYSEHVDPTILNEHATAAFRYFHTLIAGHLNLVDHYRNSFSNIRMSDWFNRPGVLEEGENMDDLTRGLATQPQLKADPYFDSEITQYLFRNGKPFGQDLRAIDIQRNRDHGLAPYNHYREFCGLPKAHSFHDFLDVISHEDVEKLATVYEHPDDVDLTVGGSLEKIVPGTLAGPTFLCILTEQFYRTRAGDRFWYENENHHTGFTIEQLQEIRKANIARLLCDNAKGVHAMQPRAFERISHKNEVVDCNLLPAIDLSYWKDTGAGKDYLGANPHPFIFKK